MLVQHLEDTHALSSQRKDMLDELWQEFQKETKQYKDSTEERKLRFEALKKKDDESARTIARQMRKLQKLQDTIAVLRQRMASNAKESELKTKAVREVSFMSMCKGTWSSYMYLQMMIALIKNTP